MPPSAANMARSREIGFIGLLLMLLWLLPVPTRHRPRDRRWNFVMTTETGHQELFADK
jgi:hypothetical protein